MMEQQRGEPAPAYTVDGSEVVSEAPGLRVVVLTLGPGQSIPWHWHSAVTDEAFGLEGEARSRAAGAARDASPDARQAQHGAAEARAPGR